MDSKYQTSGDDDSKVVMTKVKTLEHQSSESSSSTDISPQPIADATMTTAPIDLETRPEPTVREGLMAIVKSSWINVLVVFIPIGIASHFVWSPTVTFILNFIAIVPLAKLLGFATEDIALRTGEVIIYLYLLY